MLFLNVGEEYAGNCPEPLAAEGTRERPTGPSIDRETLG
jgi:hypothetical protein